MSQSWLGLIVQHENYRVCLIGSLIYSTRAFVSLAILLCAAFVQSACLNDEMEVTPVSTQGQAEFKEPVVQFEEATPTSNPLATLTPPPFPTANPTPPVNGNDRQGMGVIKITLDDKSNEFLIEGNQIRLQFLDVFEAIRCPAQGKCTDLGGATALIGISGPDVFPFILELSLATQIYNQFGYDMRLESVDRHSDGYSIVVSLKTSEGGFLGGVLATFVVDEEIFRVWVTNPVTAERVVALHRGEISKVFPTGPLLPGPGINNHNQPNRWHLDPIAVELTEVVTPECDARPSLVGDAREFWLDSVGVYCPSSAKLVDIYDFR